MNFAKMKFAGRSGCIKKKAKAKSFCHRKKNYNGQERRESNEMPGEGLLVPLGDALNGCAQVGFNGFRYSHRDQNVD